jgi:hypothetical protein
MTLNQFDIYLNQDIPSKRIIQLKSEINEAVQNALNG